MTPETAIKRQICSWLQLNGIFIFTHDSVGIYDPIKKKFRLNKDPFRLRGVSDLLGLYNGKFLAIEVKRPGTYPTKEQKEFIKKVNKLGGIAFVARSIDDVIENLNMHEQENKY